MSEDTNVAERAARIGIVTTSDRASSGTYADRSGPAIREWLTSALQTPWREEYRLIPDDQATIAETFRTLSDELGCDLVLATGGTGPSPRDVTPEALAEVAEREFPGFGELMRKVSLEQVPTAILSRQSAATRGKTLFILLPGKPQAIDVCLNAVFPAVPYCIELMGGAYIETKPEVIEAFRPKKK